jgi:plasmid stabilization system protein ParE
VRIRGKWSTTVRRVILDRSGYHLYYRARLEAGVIVVLCVWHERRRAPRL